jgi:hypothetical protein
MDIWKAFENIGIYIKKINTFFAKHPIYKISNYTMPSLVVCFI